MKKKPSLVQKIFGLLRRTRFPRFLHRVGPRKFSSWKLFLAVLLKEKLRKTYRGIVEFLPFFGMKKVPHWTTLQKFAAKLCASVWRRLLAGSASTEDCEVGAIDGTGMSRTNASTYYLKRIDREEPINQCVKLSLYVNVKKRSILSARLRAKPRHDVKDVAYLLRHTPKLAFVNLLDKGYDSQAVHAQFRDKGVCSIIPVRKGCKRGQYRREMRDCFDHAQYWQRNIVESVLSSVKRKYGGFVRSKNFVNQRSEVFAKLVLYNLELLIALLRRAILGAYS